MSEVPAGKSRATIAGLDAIRAVAAMWVVLSHVGGPPLPAAVLAATSGPARALRGLYASLFSGVSAVIVFFLISGLVIHIRQAEGGSVRWSQFLPRRYLRVGIPLLVAVLIARAASASAGLDAVLWSLYAELIYYSIYPALLWLRRRVGWGVLIATATVGYLATVAASPPDTGYSAFPFYTGWLIGLPIWLAGCALAERVAAGATARPRPAVLWRWRGVALVLSAATVGLNFHGGLKYIYTENPFGILAFAWLAREIAHFNGRDAALPWRWLERAGGWSYSLYLVHMVIHEVCARELPGDLPPQLSWALGMAAILAGAYLFHRAVEAPAQALGARVAAWSAGRVTKG